jgi:uncharacterized protein YbjT (DUF2867 family)
MNDKLIVLAGGTGDLGKRIALALIKRKANLRILVRPGSSLELPGADIVAIDFNNPLELISACKGATIVISALAGLGDVIIDTQKRLLDAAIEAKVPRFIPSDFSADFTKLPEGSNRNFDLRREFHRYLEKKPIAATTIFNGGFMDMLSGQAPFILFKFKRVLFWGNADQKLDFTTKDDTAAYTAMVALDKSTPRFLNIAGDIFSAKELAEKASEVFKTPFKLFRAGSLGMLSAIIKIVRTLSPKTKELYPAWQGMQYMHNMYSGEAKLQTIDNNRYPELKWTSVKDFLKTIKKSE